MQCALGDGTTHRSTVPACNLNRCNLAQAVVLCIAVSFLFRQVLRLAIRSKPHPFETSSAAAVLLPQVGLVKVVMHYKCMLLLVIPLFF